MVVKNAAMKTFGKQEATAKRPWLQGRDEELKRLSYVITAAKKAAECTSRLPRPLSDQHLEMVRKSKNLLKKANKTKRNK